MKENRAGPLRNHTGQQLKLGPTNFKDRKFTLINTLWLCLNYNSHDRYHAQLLDRNKYPGENGIFGQIRKFEFVIYRLPTEETIG